MNEIHSSTKKCPACGNENKLESKFCQSCGVNMDTFDSQIVEVSQTMSFRRNSYSVCCILFIVLIFYLSLVVFPNVMPPAMAVLASALFIVLLGGVSFIGLLYILWTYRGAGTRRKFIISPQSIKIIIPREPVLEIFWSKIDVIQLHKFSGSHNNKSYRFYFISEGHILDELLIEGSLHFSGANCRLIVSKLEQYTIKMNRQFIRGKGRRIK